jgi:hypothetical protein
LASARCASPTGIEPPAAVDCLEACDGTDGPIAQRLEQETHNLLVPGSNPGGPTTHEPGLAPKRAPVSKTAAWVAPQALPAWILDEVSPQPAWGGQPGLRCRTLPASPPVRFTLFTSTLRRSARRCRVTLAAARTRIENSSVGCAAGATRVDSRRGLPAARLRRSTRATLSHPARFAAGAVHFVHQHPTPLRAGCGRAMALR